MSGFLGRHEFQIDGKGRVSFPSPFRRVVSGGPLVLLKWRSTHLDLFPPEKWAEIRRTILDGHPKNGDRRDFIRRFAGQAVEVEPDAHGRIRIPPQLRADVGLEKVALFIGALDRIEIWNPARFDDHMARAEDDDGFAAHVFG